MSASSIVKAKKYKVQDGDSIESIAKSAGITWQQLAKFNWGTDNPDAINKHLREDVGCFKKTKDGHNYIFTSKDDPGIIYIPQELPAKSFSSSATHVITVDPVVKKSFIPADCIVKFRPNTSWNGEYGFDWMREADFPILIDSKSLFGSLKFQDIMGYYMVKNKGFLVKIKEFFYKIFKYFGMKDPVKWTVQPDGNAYYGDRPFDIVPSMFEKLENEYGRVNIELSNYGTKKYKSLYASYLNLYLDDDKFKLPREIKIQAFIEVNTVPEELYLKYDKDYFKIDKETLPKASQKVELKIKCLKELNSDMHIEARSIFRDEKGLSHDILVGKLNVLANSKDKVKKIKVLLVKVKTPSLSPIGQKTGDPEKNINFVEKTLHQALLSPDIDRLNLDFTQNAIISQNFINNYNKNGRLLSKGLSNSKKYLDAFCLDQLKSEHSDFETKYGNHLKAFYFGVDSDEGLYGYSLGKNVVMFGSALESTAVHEWLHSLGLPHTFCGRGKFTYEYTKTENIMDYTHHLAIDNATEHYKKARISLYFWQWNIVHS
jgi:hypothetical protein